MLGLNAILGSFFSVFQNLFSGGIVQFLQQIFGAFLPGGGAGQ